MSIDALKKVLANSNKVRWFDFIIILGKRENLSEIQYKELMWVKRVFKNRIGVARLI